MSERLVQNAIIKYICLQYPNAVFRTDKDGQFAKGSALWDKARQKGKKGFPDLIIADKIGVYNGLVIELKKEGISVYRKDGSLRKDDHLQDQSWWLSWFSQMGCYTSFAIGFEDAKGIIDNYFNNRL